MGNSFAHKGYVGPADGAPVTPDILHIYQHSYHHGTSAIIGNKDGLLALRKAIDEVLSKPEEITSTCVDVVPADDGEGYSLIVYKADKPFTDPFWSNLPSTYELSDEMGDMFAPIEFAKNKSWPCPECFGFGKVGDDIGFFSTKILIEQVGVACTYCNATGIVHEKPSK